MTFPTLPALDWINRETARQKKLLELAGGASAAVERVNWAQRFVDKSSMAMVARQAALSELSWMTVLKTPAYQQFLDRQNEILRRAVEPSVAVNAAMKWLASQRPATVAMVESVLGSPPDTLIEDNKIEDNKIEETAVEDVEPEVEDDQDVEVLLEQLISSVQQLTKTLATPASSTPLIQNNIVIVIGLLTLIATIIGVCYAAGAG